MRHTTRLLALALAVACTAATAADNTPRKPAARKAAAPVPSAHDYPTLDRVLYVQDCLRAHPGPAYEMLSKCSCAIDRVAEAATHDDYVSMTTIANAITIGGERGGDLRDNETLKPQIARWRELQAKARKACFIGASP